MTAPVIKLTNVCKSYRLYKQRPFLAREFFRMLLQRPSAVDVHHALTDVSFEVMPGESVGVLGRNGAGKSTLLSLVAKTSYPTSGTVEVNGTIGPLLELGAGFHPDLSGHENVFLNAAILGLTRSEIEDRFDAIADFAEIGEFMDAPLHCYSTGMRARLGFAVIAQVDPDIVLIDEILAVGDAQFQAKCNKTISGFKEAGKNLFLVSHNMSDISRLCERAIWLERGRVAGAGPTDEVISNYMEYTRGLSVG